MIRVFSAQTLAKFEDASASIPLRALDRAFTRADLHATGDPGGELGGARRIQFRRYVDAVDQRDPQQLNRFGDALGALIGEVATSKQNFLVSAAEQDGFVFAGGVFRPASLPASFSLTSAGEFARIDDYSRRLHIAANDRPHEALEGARELCESVCRMVLHGSGKPIPQISTDLAAIVDATLDAFESGATDDADLHTFAVVRNSVVGLAAVVSGVDELRSSAADPRHGVEPRHVTARHARLAVGAAITLARFIIEGYQERVASKRL